MWRQTTDKHTVVPHAPGAPLTFRDQNTGKRSSGAIAAKNPAEDTSSPREQADNHGVGPNNMITLNSDGPTSKSLPVIEITSAGNGAKIEQIPDPRNAAVEEAAAEKRVAQEANEPKAYVLPNGMAIIPVTAQQFMTVAESKAAEKASRDKKFENHEDTEELTVLLEGQLNAEGMKMPWILDEMGFHGGLRIWYLRTWRDFISFEEEHIICAAETSPHLSIQEDECGDAMVVPGDGSGRYGEIEYAEVDDEPVAQRWLPSLGDPRLPDLQDENKHDPNYRSEGEGYKVHNSCSIDDGGPITFELCDYVQPDEDERNAWFEECSEEFAFEGHG